MILSKWKGHLKLLQPVTLFSDLVALAVVAGVVVLFQPLSFLTGWIFKLFNIEGPSMLKWGIFGFCTLSLGLKYWMFRQKGIKDSQWVDKKWLKEFHQFTPSQLDHYADAHFKFHRLISAIWIGACLMNFSTTGFLLLGVGHIIATYYWKAHQQVKTKNFLPHGEMEHFPMEVIGAVQDPMEIVSNLQDKIKETAKNKLVSHPAIRAKVAGSKISSRSSKPKLAALPGGQQRSAAASHARHTIKQAAKHVKQAAKHTKQEVKHGVKAVKNDLKPKH